jgi:hypothetical protein
MTGVRVMYHWKDHECSVSTNVHVKGIDVQLHVMLVLSSVSRPSSPEVNDCQKTGRRRPRPVLCSFRRHGDRYVFRDLATNQTGEARIRLPQAQVLISMSSAMDFIL